MAPNLCGPCKEDTVRQVIPTSVYQVAVSRKSHPVSRKGHPVLRHQPSSHKPMGAATCAGVLAGRLSQKICLNTRLFGEHSCSVHLCRDQLVFAPEEHR